MLKTKNTGYVFAIPALIAILLAFLCSCDSRKTRENENDRQLIAWTYDSFASEWGPGPEVARIFEEKTGIAITWVSHGDAGEMAARFILEGKNSGADIILGIDQNLGGRVIDSGLLEEYTPMAGGEQFSELMPGLRGDDGKNLLIPMDYSYFAIVYDSEKLPIPPKSLEELAKPGYARSLILIDPRTSSVGLGFFCWVREVYGDGWKDYWTRLRPSILTVAEGWSTAYGLFVNGEAPMVLSYTTSPGYHLEYENSERYRAAIFAEGHPLQLETAGLSVSARNKENARLFLDFMLSRDFQEIIPLTNWMYPVIDIPLPASFRINPKSPKTLTPAPATEEELNEWAALMMAAPRN